MATRNPPWERDELILALDLYLRSGRRSLPSSHPDVIELSNVLADLPKSSDGRRSEHSRSPSAVAMKLANFAAIDPQFRAKSLQHVGKLDRQVWNEFSAKRGQLARLADAIRRGQADTRAALPSDDPDEDAFPEGRALYRLHRARERSPSLVRRAKMAMLRRDGRLQCQVCGFDFAAVYGPVGEGYIECHHAMPLSEVMTQRTTRVSDTALVCANCHRMLHRRRPWLQLAELRTVLVDDAERA